MAAEAERAASVGDPHRLDVRRKSPLDWVKDGARRTKCSNVFSPFCSTVPMSRGTQKREGSFSIDTGTCGALHK